VRKPVLPGLALVGDAAIAADPLFGIGCGWAFQSGEWLAEALDGSLGSDQQVDDALEAYRRRHRAGLNAHEKFVSAYSTGRRFNPMEKLIYRAGARDQVVATQMALMGERWISPNEMLNPRLLGRIARVNLRRGGAPLGLRRSAPQAAA
jgi:2-polyprenyl-6-methoxyphenol hydroxylase-like FAD-dependent oxidoreductase